MKNTREFILINKISTFQTFFSDFRFLDLLNVGKKEFVGRVICEFRKIGLQWRETD